MKVIVLLLLIFVSVPLVELVILIEAYKHAGGMPVLMVLFAGTGILGAVLARRAGLGAIKKLRKDLAMGQVPAEAVIDGVLVLVAGALLLAPGILTDILGLSLFTRPVRASARSRLKRALEKRVRSNVTFD